MKSGNTFLVTIVTTIAAGVVALLAYALKWSTSSWLLVMLLLLAGSAGVALHLTRRTAAEPADVVNGLPEPVFTRYPEPVDLPPAPPSNETIASDIPLPSAVPDYAFRFSATVRWQPLPNPAGPANANPGGLALASILARAGEITRHRPPTEFALMQHRLGGELGTILPEGTGQLAVWATDVVLGLAEADRDRLRKLADVRKDEEVWEHERNYERNKRTYLGDDVLKTAGSAVVWWLSKRDDAIERAVDLIGPLAQLSAAANDDDIPDRYRHLVSVPWPAAADELDLDASAVSSNGTTGNGAGHVVTDPPAVSAADRVADLLDTLRLGSGDDDKRALFAHDIAGTLARFGFDDDARAIRERFMPPPDEPEPQSGEWSDDTPER